jgi:hypothetical protein
MLTLAPTRPFDALLLQVTGLVTDESACTPGSVPAPPRWCGDGHLSTAAVADSL